LDDERAQLPLISRLLRSAMHEPASSPRAEVVLRD
jgi:hypothetical protein